MFPSRSSTVTTSEMLSRSVARRRASDATSSRDPSGLVAALRTGDNPFIAPLNSAERPAHRTRIHRPRRTGLDLQRALKLSVLSVGVINMAEQFHFDPDTYLTWCGPKCPTTKSSRTPSREAAGEIVATTVLDLGTGTGETLWRVAQRHPSARLIGIDESESMLGVAQRLVPTADLRVARLQDELPEGPFDLVVSALAVHHLDPSEKAALFRRVAERLAPVVASYSPTSSSPTTRPTA